MGMLLNDLIMRPTLSDVIGLPNWALILIGAVAVIAVIAVIEIIKNKKK